MANHYKILRKARLVEELFVTDRDDAAWAQEEAERDWARDHDPWRGAPGARVLEAGSASFPELLEAPAEGVARALIAPPAPRRNWSKALAELTGNPGLEGMRALGVCGLERSSGPTVAALAQWVGRHCETPALLVEAHLGEPALAELLQTGSEGVFETVSRTDSVTSLVRETGDPNLMLLAAGAALRGPDRRKVASELPALIGSLKERYAAVVVELPAVQSPHFEKVQPAALVEGVILAADPRTARPRDLQKASEALRAAGVRLIATLLDAPEALAAQSGQGRPPQRRFA